MQEHIEVINGILSQLDRMPQLSVRIGVWVQILENLCAILHMTSGYIVHHDFTKGVSTSICQYTSEKSKPNEREAMPGETFVEREFPDTVQWLASENVQPRIIITHELEPDNPEYLEMVAGEVKTALFFKLKSKDKIWGYVELWDSEHEQVFSEAQLNYGLQVADKLAQTLKNWV